MLLRTPILPMELQQLVGGELRDGEKLLWADQPIPGLYGMQSIVLVLFSIPWTAFAIFWITSAASMSGKTAGPENYFPLFGIPFVLIGVGMMSSPLWFAFKARRSVYAVTNQRAIVIERSIFGGLKIQSFGPDRLTSMIRRERSSGNGDLIFEESWRMSGDSRQRIRRGFMGVRGVREVEDLIRATLLPDRGGAA